MSTVAVPDFCADKQFLALDTEIMDGAFDSFAKPLLVHVALCGIKVSIPGLDRGSHTFRGLEPRYLPCAKAKNWNLDAIMKRQCSGSFVHTAFTLSFAVDVFSC